MEQKVVPRGLAAVAEADPGRAAIVFAGKPTTFAQLDHLSNAFARAIFPYIREPGERVGVMLGNSAETFGAWHGVARVGALVVPVNTRLTAPEAAYMLRDSGSVALVSDTSAAALAAAEEAGIPMIEVSDVVGSSWPDAPPVGDWIATPVTTMQYTSGTTGRPKGIRRTAPAPASEAPPNPFAAFWGFGPEDVH
ncbi:MAG TPA: class I adenylate-forming enzyme family protein, partial [Acidimicrobiales bacterium]|nr:class I adenylate-forming enzyme family protein [Acidimicrobiales bacterium]